MHVQDLQNQTPCPAADISAYLDCELSPQAELDLERHLASCGACTSELNDQRSLLLALDSSFEEPTLELPKNFTKAVVAAAESRVSGLRCPSERLNAVLVCTSLLLFSVFAFGGSFGPIFGAVSSVLQATVAVAEASGHFVYGIFFGSAVIFKTLFLTFLTGSRPLVFLYIAVFFGAVFLVSRLFSRPRGA